MSNTIVTLHTFAATFHIIQALVLFKLVQKRSFKWPVVSRNLNKITKSHMYHIGYLLPSFSLLSSFNHLLSIIYSNYYNNNIRKTQVNTLRWCEYSVSAGIMLWIICTLSGIVEFRTLISISILNGALQYVGYLLERAKAKHQHDTINDLLTLGWCIHITIWLQIFVSFYTVLQDLKYNQDNQNQGITLDIPDIVYSMVPIMFIMFSSFGIVSALWSKHHIKSFDMLEVYYLILSIISKSILSWLVYGGVIQEPRNEFN